MFDLQGHLAKLPRFRLGLIISNYFGLNLPEETLETLAALPPEKKHEFFQTFDEKAAKLPMIYLSSTVYGHYLLLGRWSMTGWMWCSVFVAGALGLIWWLVDLVRMPEMIREHNQRIAIEILQTLAAPVPTEPPAVTGS